jgi:hypothetical protein
VTQAFKNLLNKDQHLKAYLQKAEYLINLQAHLQRATPPALGAFCQVAGLVFGTLTVIAANATVAAKLRQLAPEILNLLKNQGCEVSGLLVKVQVSYTVAPVVHPPRRLSGVAQNTLSQFGNRLPDSALRNTLLKIVKNSQR